jgi:hypothetical protein
MMHGAHIGGQRAGAFLELVGGIDPRRVLLVGVDVAKATWFVIAANLLGEVVVDGVRLVADRAGLAERLIQENRRKLDAEVVVVGIEAAGHQHQTLTGHLLDRGDLVVRLLNPAQVAAVRKQQGNRRRKTDWLDAAAVCELLARGEGAPVPLDDSAASALRPLWSGRKGLVDTRGPAARALARAAPHPHQQAAQTGQGRAGCHRNAVGRTLFALMATGADYDPTFPTTRAERRKAGRRAA